MNTIPKWIVTKHTLMPRTIKGRKIKIAVVGCGRIAAKHFDAIEQHNENLELVGVCDIDPEVLDNTVTRTGAPGYDDLRALLKNAHADLVTICTPSGLHPAQTVRCAKSGCHVMTEKPMATHWSDGLRMVSGS